MTAVWGPLGWMTLHSVATSYPIQPTRGEEELMTAWLDMFRDTITCPSCRDHFKSLLANYRQTFPNMLASRQNFAMFSFRAHNAVNRRLNKPIYGDVEACMNLLRNNVKNRSAKDYRTSYLAHITRHWSIYRDITGISALRKITEMNKIEREYIGPHDNNFTAVLSPDVVVLPQDTLDRTPREPGPQRPVLRQPVQGFRLTGAGIRIRR
jgi:hypothetical protein